MVNRIQMANGMKQALPICDIKTTQSKVR